LKLYSVPSGDDDRILDFYRQGFHPRYDADNNNLGQINFYDKAFGSAALLAEVVIHEIGHNWDSNVQAESNPLWGSFLTIRAGGEGFVSSYAKTNAQEDFAESLAAHFYPDRYANGHQGSEAIVAQKLELIGSFIIWLRQ
jgi:hypothetical protein